MQHAGTMKHCSVDICGLITNKMMMMNIWVGYKNAKITVGIGSILYIQPKSR